MCRCKNCSDVAPAKIKYGGIYYPRSVVPLRWTFDFDGETAVCYLCTCRVGPSWITQPYLWGLNGAVYLEFSNGLILWGNTSGTRVAYSNDTPTNGNPLDLTTNNVLDLVQDGPGGHQASITLIPSSETFSCECDGDDIVLNKYKLYDTETGLWTLTHINQDTRSSGSGLGSLNTYIGPYIWGEDGIGDYCTWISPIPNGPVQQVTRWAAVIKPTTIRLIRFTTYGDWGFARPTAAVSNSVHLTPASGYPTGDYDTSGWTWQHTILFDQTFPRTTGCCGCAEQFDRFTLWPMRAFAQNF